MNLHAPLAPVAVCLMAGIGLEGCAGRWTTALALLAVAVVVTAAAYRWPRWQTAGIYLCALFLGMALGGRQRESLDVRWPETQIRLPVVVVGEPVAKGRWVVADALTAEGHHRLRCRIARDSLSERIAAGDGLLLRARVRPVREWSDGHFSYRRHMQSHGFDGEVLAGGHQWQWQEVALAGLSSVERLRLRFLCWRSQLLRRYRQWAIDAGAYGVIAAMTLGERSAIAPGLRETYARVGASHILALSGLHLSIIYSVITLFVGWGRTRVLSQALIVTAIWAFALLTGLSPSVTRSAMMLTLYALLSVGHRERMSVNTLAFAAMAMLVAHPYTLYDTGFQLSLLSVLAIVLLNPLFQRLIPPHVSQRHRWHRALWGMTTVSLSAQAGTAPLVAYYFGRLPTYFLLSNLVVIPLATLTLWLALACLATFWWVAAQQLLAAAMAQTVNCMSRMLTLVAALPGSSIEGIRLSAWQVALTYALLASCYVLAVVCLRQTADDKKHPGASYFLTKGRMDEWTNGRMDEITR